MADDSIFDQQTLEEAKEGFREFSNRLDRLIGEPERKVDSIISFLRTIPADEFQKKIELAKFFQTREGQGYDTSERRKAYDELLGRDRNRRTFG